MNQRIHPIVVVLTLQSLQLDKFQSMQHRFTVNYQELLNYIDTIDPIKYGRTRNFVNGAVTRLSPYISRGIISTKSVLNAMLARGYEIEQMEKFVQELAWRDYFQQVWNVKSNAIDADMKNTQSDVVHHQLPTALTTSGTGIEAIDKAIVELQETGYMHNHLRMYTASIATNCARAHWRVPAQWMYYHLLDADWASNALSWQWVAGAFSSKKYIANQENINRYTNSQQYGTYLDCEYTDIPPRDIPIQLQGTHIPEFVTPLPEHTIPVLNANSTVALYTMYNLDPLWRNEESCERILILEPSLFKCYPVCKRTIDFIQSWASSIPNLQLAVCEFGELQSRNPTATFLYKQHPTNKHFYGVCDERDWIFPEVKGYFPSFFGYWKQCEKYIAKKQQSLFS